MIATVLTGQIISPASQGTESRSLNSDSIAIKAQNSSDAISESAPLAGSDDLAEAYQKGRKKAEEDVRSGKLNIHFGGIVVPNQKFKDIMLKKYGVTVITSGCTMTPSESEWLRGYDEVSRAAIEKRFGQSIIETVRQSSEHYSSKPGHD